MCSKAVILWLSIFFIAQTFPISLAQEDPQDKNPFSVEEISPTVLDLGSSDEIRVRIKNLGDIALKYVRFTLEFGSGGNLSSSGEAPEISVFGSSQRSYESIGSNEEKELVYPVAVAPTSQYYQCSLFLSVGYLKGPIEKSFKDEYIGTIALIARPDIHIVDVRAETRPGYWRITGEVHNTGFGEALGTILSLPEDETHGSGEWVVGDLAPDDFDTFEIIIPAKKEASGTVQLNFAVHYTRGGTDESQSTSISKAVSLPSSGSGSSSNLLTMVAFAVLIAIIIFLLVTRRKYGKT